MDLRGSGALYASLSSMQRSPAMIQFGPEDFIPLPVEQLCHHARVSRAFVKVCLASGCPLEDGRLSHAQLIEWLRKNYGHVREMVGLAPLAPIDGVDADALNALGLANSLVTLLEFSISRSSDAAQRRELRRVLRYVERSV